MTALTLPAYTNWNWVTPRLAVGGEPPPAAYPILHRYGFEAVIDLRDPTEAAGTQSSHHVARLHVPTPDRLPPAPDDLDRALSFIVRQHAGQSRVLVHCVHGIGRSAIVALSALVAEGHAPLDALCLTKNRRWKISPSPEQFAAWASWLSRHRQMSGAIYDLPSFESFAAIAYRHLAQA